MSSDTKVEIRGLAELSRAFKAVDAELPRELKTEFLAIAQTVVAKVQGKLPRDSGKAADSIKPRGTSKGAAIAFGGSKAPYEPWLDFGGSVGRGHQNGPWQGAIKRQAPKGGNYVYPTIAESKDEIRTQVEHAIEKVAERHQFETKVG